MKLIMDITDGEVEKKINLKKKIEKIQNSAKAQKFKVLKKKIIQKLD